MPEMEPITREETYYARAAGGNITVPEPVTHKEHFLYALATGETGGMPEAVTREEHFIEAAAESGGGDVRVVQLTATENGTYSAPAGSAYSPVVVATSAPTISSLTATENGTYTAPEGTAYSPVYVNTSASRINVQLSIDPHDTEVTIYGPLGSGGGEIYAYTRVVPSESITSYSLSVVKNDSAYTNLCLSDGYEFVYLTGQAVIGNQGKTVQIRGEASLRLKPIDGYEPTLDPEVLTGTVAEPWTMAQAEVLWNICEPFLPSAAVLTCIPVNTMGVLQCVTLAVGSSTNRRLIVGASAPASGGVGVVSIQYSLDSEGEPREHVSMDSKIVWVCTDDTAPQDVSALVSASSPTKTLVSLYSNPVPLADD